MDIQLAMASRSAARPGAQRRWCALVALGASAPAEAFPPLNGAMGIQWYSLLNGELVGATMIQFIQPHDSLSKDIQTYLRVPSFRYLFSICVKISCKEKGK